VAALIAAVVVGCFFGGIWLLVGGSVVIGVVLVTAGSMLGMTFLFLS